MASRNEGDLIVTGNLSMGSISLPNSSIDNDAISPDINKRIDATKQQHQHELHFIIDHTVEITAIKQSIHTIRGFSGKIIGVDVVTPLAPVGPGDKLFTVDVLKSNQAAPTLVSVLSSLIQVDDTEFNYEVHLGTINASQADVDDGDTLTIDVAVSGTSGTQAQGLIVTLTIREDPE